MKIEDDGEEEVSGISFNFESGMHEDAGGIRTQARVSGGRAAVPKPITADYDEDDRVLVYMKNMGYSDQQVVEAFKRDGRTVYSKQSVNGRYMRLLRVMEDKNDDLLARELAEWTEEHVSMPQE